MAFLRDKTEYAAEIEKAIVNGNQPGGNATRRMFLGRVSSLGVDLLCSGGENLEGSIQRVANMLDKSMYPSNSEAYMLRIMCERVIAIAQEENGGQLTSHNAINTFVRKFKSVHLSENVEKGLKNGVTQLREKIRGQEGDVTTWDEKEDRS